MADQLDVIWVALLILHRENPIDENQPVWTQPISCTVVNNEGPVQITREMMEQNAVNFVAERTGENPANLQLVDVNWVAAPYVDASELPPPAPESAHGND